MDHDTSSNDLWTMDRILLNPGLAVDLLNRRSIRETELLRKISDMTDELRTAKSATKPVVPEIVAPKVKTVEDYAISIAGGLAAALATVNKRNGEDQAQAEARWVFERADAMVDQAERRQS